MNTELELLKLLKEIDELKRKVNILEGKDENQIPTYQYSNSSFGVHVFK
jgi:vacuolar-type H+-ATPase subunit D/Vma8